MPASDLDLLIRAAEAAGDIALKYWNKQHQTWDKGDGEGPVTEADLEVDEMLQGTLLGARSDYGWLSEESDDLTDRMSKSSVFVVDPIDGTRSFIAGDRTWAHAFAVVDDGVPTAGVVYLPAREEMYTATADGAFLNGKPIWATETHNLDNAEILAPRNVLDADNWKGDPPGFSRHFRPSLAYRMALVAEGRFDAMITFRDAWEWDIAAGAIIAEAAGAISSDRQSEKLRFNSEGRKLKGVLIGNPAIHSALAARLR